MKGILSEMKKEVLRIRDIKLQNKTGNELKYINFYLLEGEITGFLGLENSGKDILVNILSGKQRFDSGFVSVYGERIITSDDLANFVYKMKDSNYFIEDWSVAEYIGLVDNRLFGGILRKKALIDVVQKIFDILKIEIAVHRKLGDLSEIEKRLVDIAKAYQKDAKILIIEDEFDGLSQKEIQCFKTELMRIICGRMTVIINNHSDMVTGILAEKLIIFKKGEIVKKCMAECIRNSEYLEKYLMGTSIRSQKKTLDNMRLNQTGQSETIYRIAHVKNKSGKEMEFLFQRGEITTILVLDRKEKEKIFKILSGRIKVAGVKRWISETFCEFEDISDYVRHRIISIMYLGNIEELLPGMSIGENILMPSLNKISSLEYTLTEHKMIKVLEKEIERSGIIKNEKIRELGINDRITLTLERWYVYSPKVIILFEPFALCDTYGVALVKSYINKIASGGTAVIVVKSREEYMEDSDNFIHV